MARLRVSGKAIDKTKKKFAKFHAGVQGAYGAGIMGAAGKVAKLGGAKTAGLALLGAGIGAAGGALAGKIHGSAYARQKARSIAAGKKQTTLRKVGRVMATGTGPGLAWTFAKTKKSKTS